MDEQTRDLILTVGVMAENARKRYESTQQWDRSGDMGACMTICVPTALLNRIRELAKSAGVVIPPAV